MSRKYRELVLNVSVEKALRTKPFTVLTSDSLHTCVERMVRENIGAVIVLEKKLPVGIITEKDVLERAIIPEKNMYQTKAEDIMSKPLISIEADLPVKEALELMKKNNVRRLVITKNNSLIGLVTERRLLRIIGKYYENEKESNSS
jgi:CBS domain-containing protein